MVFGHDGDHRQCGIEGGAGRCGGNGADEFLDSELRHDDDDQLVLGHSLLESREPGGGVARMLRHRPESEQRESEAATGSRVALQRPAHGSPTHQIAARQFRFDGGCEGADSLVGCESGIIAHLGCTARAGSAQPSQRHLVVGEEGRSGDHPAGLVEASPALASGAEQQLTAVVLGSAPDRDPPIAHDRIERLIRPDRGDIDDSTRGRRAFCRLGKMVKTHLIMRLLLPPPIGYQLGDVDGRPGHNENLHLFLCVILLSMNMLRALPLAAATLLGVAACSPVERTVDPISAEDLAAAVHERLESEIDVPFEVICHEPLAAAVDASALCNVSSPADSEGNVTVEAVVTSVDTETGVVEFDINADPETQIDDESDEDAGDSEDSEDSE